MVTFAFPYALEAIGWKTYMINATWDVLEVLFIIFVWIETSNKTLEEIDELIDGQMHSDAPALLTVIKGDIEVTKGQSLGLEPETTVVNVTTKADTIEI